MSASSIALANANLLQFGCRHGLHSPAWAAASTWPRASVGDHQSHRILTCPWQRSRIEQWHPAPRKDGSRRSSAATIISCALRPSFQLCTHPLSVAVRRTVAIACLLGGLSRKNASESVESTLCHLHPVRGFKRAGTATCLRVWSALCFYQFFFREPPIRSPEGMRGRVSSWSLCSFPPICIASGPVFVRPWSAQSYRTNCILRKRRFLLGSTATVWAGALLPSGCCTWCVSKRFTSPNASPDKPWPCS